MAKRGASHGIASIDFKLHNPSTVISISGCGVMAEEAS